MNALAKIPAPVEAKSKPLTVRCERCEDGVRWTSRYGGNDPDVWRVGPCEHCDGTGDRTLCCDGCSDPEAVEWFQGFKWCAACAAEQKADALSADEDADQSAATAEEEAEQERADNSWCGVGS